VLELASLPLLRERLSRAALVGVRERTWERALARLGEGYRRVVAAKAGAEAQADPDAVAADGIVADLSARAA